MINTDASGQGSLRYGKTSDHVLALKAVLADGSVLDTSNQDSNPEGSFADKAVKTTFEICSEYRPQIEEKFPDLNRFLTGYDLKNALDGERFASHRVLCGSEGSLGFITERNSTLLLSLKSEY